MIVGKGRETKRCKEEIRDKHTRLTFYVNLPPQRKSQKFWKYKEFPPVCYVISWENTVSYSNLLPSLHQSMNQNKIAVMSWLRGGTSWTRSPILLSFLCFPKYLEVPTCSMEKHRRKVVVLLEGKITGNHCNDGKLALLPWPAEEVTQAKHQMEIIFRCQS